MQSCVGNLDKLEWTDDSQLLSVSLKNGTKNTVHVHVHVHAHVVKIRIDTYIFNIIVLKAV